jgi:RNA polymerase sigma-54 factor
VQSQRPALVQEQKLKMNPQLYQSIQLMALPIQDLRFRIQQEIEANPALEIMDDSSTVSLDDVEPAKTDEEEYLQNLSDDGDFSSGYDDQAGDAKRQFMEGALARPESLHEHLLWQLRLQPISEERFRLGELLINNLDENGFHREDPSTLVRAGSETLLSEMIDMIRGFDPVGTCVSDYRESLRIQAELAPEHPDGTIDIIEQYLDALDRGKTKDVAKKMKVDVEQVEICLDFIRGLTPFPGRLFSSDKPTYVIPDLMVRLKDGEVVIIMNEEEIPVLKVNPFFENMSFEKVKTPESTETKQFVTSKLRDARWFIHSIHQRNQTLLKVSRAIVEFQRDFFLRGAKYLKPLTLKDIAEEVGVHEATVSRITTAKYVQTEFGIFELKYFFSNSISGAGSTGSRFSKEGVKQVIREILEAESTEQHLSDQKISDLLSKRGINIARRTVAKYRKELAISSSYER